jgi:hypothetical protein
MEVKITVEIKNADGSLATESTTVEAEVPDFEAYSGPEKFGEEFDEYERKVIKARNKAIEVATEKYLSELAKKKVSWRQRSGEENWLKGRASTA